MLSQIQNMTMVVGKFTYLNISVNHRNSVTRGGIATNVISKWFCNSRVKYAYSITISQACYLSLSTYTHITNTQIKQSNKHTKVFGHNFFYNTQINHTKYA